MKPLTDCILYTFIDFAYLRGRDPAELARQLCDGGSDLIQLRAKTASKDEIQRWAERIKPATDRAGVGLIINDHPDIAQRIGADGCHLGQEDFFDAGLSHCKQVTGTPPAFTLGLSSHSPEQALKAEAAGADYVAVGPVYATATKPGRPAVTLEYVRWAAREIRVPWFAIGGLTLSNLDDVLAAGARRIAVVSAILESPTVMEACQRFRDRLGFAPKK